MGVGALMITSGRAVFLDRDGVINRCFVRGGVPHPPQALVEVGIEDGVTDSLAKLRAAGYLLLVVTNQPDVARGAQSQAIVEAINAQLCNDLPIDDVAVCYHDNADNCDCRKPKPGMLLRAAGEHGVDLARSFMVGDRWGDVVAGAAAGCKTLLIDLPYSQCDRCSPDHKVADLLEAARVIEGLTRL